MYGHELVDAFREFKRIWDPDGQDEPGQEGRRLSHRREPAPRAALRPAAVETHFAFPDDDGSFARATERCVGVGKCRRTDREGGTHVPELQVTHEEKHSTRGRAHLLFEMLQQAS